MSIPNLPGVRALYILQCVARSKTIAQAAESLQVTPSALSHQLREMEEQTGSTLFVRRPLSPTRAGERLLKLADTVTQAYMTAERDLLRLQSGEAGRLILAIECHSCFDWLMPVVDDFRRHWPAVVLDFRSAMQEDAQQALARGELDLVLTSDPARHDGITALPLFDYESVLLVAPTHPLAGRSSVGPADLAGETLISYPVDESRLDVFREFLTPAGVRPARVRHAELTPLLVQLVASGHGVAALPHWVAYEYLQRGWVRAVALGEGTWCTLSAAVREEDLVRGYVRDFVAAARDACLATLHGARLVESARPIERTG